MIEKVITVRDKDVGLRGLLFVNDVDIGYVDRKVIMYCDSEIEPLISSVLDNFEMTKVNIRDIEKELRVGLVNSLKTHDIIVSRAIPFISGNKNKSSRNKRLLEALEKKNFIKVVKYVGI